MLPFSMHTLLPRISIVHFSFVWLVIPPESMHSFSKPSTLFTSLLLLLLHFCTLTLALPPIFTTERAKDNLPDPFQLRVYKTPVSLIFSGFSDPYTHFEALQLLDIAHEAQ